MSGKVSWFIGLVQEHKASGFMEDHKWMKKYEKNLDPW